MTVSLTDSPIFVGGVPRSGTTLLRVILDSHPRIFCGTELRAVQALAMLWQSASDTAQPLLSQAYATDPQRLRRIFGGLILSFLEPAWRASGKARVAEKTPSNFLAFPQLAVLFPQSPLIHVIRDGRDIVASRLERDRIAAQGKPLDTVALAAVHAREWVEAMALRRAILGNPQLSRCYYEIRYEKLISEPEPALTSLFEFIGERFDPCVLAFHRIERNVAGTEEWSAEAVKRPIFTTSAGRWKHSLSADEHDAVVRVAGGELVALGYRAAGDAA
jgi:protein-tyrosine sulfotransferase